MDRRDGRVRGPAVEAGDPFLEDWELETAEGVEQLRDGRRPALEEQGSAASGRPLRPRDRKPRTQQVLLMAIYAARATDPDQPYSFPTNSC